MLLGTLISIEALLWNLFGSVVVSIGLVAIILPAYYKLMPEKNYLFMGTVCVLFVLSFMISGHALPDIVNRVCVEASSAVAILGGLVMSALLLLISYFVSQEI